MHFNHDFSNEQLEIVSGEIGGLGLVVLEIALKPNPEVVLFLWTNSVHLLRIAIPMPPWRPETVHVVREIIIAYHYLYFFHVTKT